MYRNFCDSDTRAILECTDDDVVYDTLPKKFSQLKFATTAAIRACGEIIASVYLDLHDQNPTIMHKVNVVSDGITSTVQLIELESRTVIASFHCVDVDANDGNDES